MRHTKKTFNISRRRSITNALLSSNLAAESPIRTTPCGSSGIMVGVSNASFSNIGLFSSGVERPENIDGLDAGGGTSFLGVNELFERINRGNEGCLKRIKCDDDSFRRHGRRNRDIFMLNDLSIPLCKKG